MSIDSAPTTSSRFLGLLLSLGLLATAVGCSDNGGTPSDDGDTGMADASSDTGDVGLNAPGSRKEVRSFETMPVFPTTCGGSNGREYRLPFYYKSAGQLKPIKKGDIVNDRVVEGDSLINAGLFAAQRSRVSTNQTCESASECPGSFKCGEAGVRGAKRYCTRQTGIEFLPGTIQFDNRSGIDPDDRQLVTLLVQNTGSLDGLLPNSVSTLYGPDGETDISAEPARATDPDGLLDGAVDIFGTNLATAASPDDTSVSLWSFAGESPARARPAFDPMAENDHFISDLGRIGDAVSDFPSQRPAPANLYQSILRVIDKDLSLQKYQNHEKHLVVMVDGPNGLYDPSATKQAVQDRLNEHNIKLYVLHFDTPIDASMLRDVPQYWRGNQNCQNDEGCGAPACSSDSDCANFETCRPATIYAESEGGEVTETDNSYCLPEYGSNGRLGPITEYQELACNTGGHYTYIESAEDLGFFAQRVPYLFDGQWSIKVDISSLDERVGLSNGYYRLSSIYFNLIRPTLSQTVSATGPGTTHPADNRGLLRVDREGNEQ
jgi:hypothetical protein